MVRIDKKIFEDVTKITGGCDVTTEYDGYVYIEDEYIDSLLEDLVTEYHRKEEELEDEIQQRKDFYTPKSPYDVYGVNERDFI